MKVLGIFNKMTVFEQVAGDQILETFTSSRDVRPVPEIEFGRLPDRTNARCTERRCPETDVEIFQNLNPAAHRFERELSIYAQTLDRKGWVNPIGSCLDQ